MHRKYVVTLLLVLGMFTAAESLPYFQGKGKSEKAEDKDKDKKKTGKEEEEKPQPLFGGKVGLKSSRQSKDQATLGFNGIGPNGQVEQGAINASTTSDAAAKAAAMSTYTVPAGEVDAFIKEGNLGSAAAPKKTGARRIESPKRQASASASSERRGL